MFAKLVNSTLHLLHRHGNMATTIPTFEETKSYFLQTLTTRQESHKKTSSMPPKGIAKGETIFFNKVTAQVIKEKSLILISM